jgi:uncharacterized protein (DUF433 family)
MYNKPMSLAVENPPVPLRADEQGVMRVGDTRVRLDTVITAWKQGASPEQIVENFDVLELADVYAVIGYYLRNRAKVEEYLNKNRSDGQQLQDQNEQRFPQMGIRERLLARQASKS